MDVLLLALVGIAILAAGVRLLFLAQKPGGVRIALGGAALTILGALFLLGAIWSAGTLVAVDSPQTSNPTLEVSP